MKTRPPQVRTSLLDAVSHNDLQLKEVTTLRGRRRAGQGVARRRVMLLAIAAMVWAVARAGADRDLVNADGWPSFTRFFRAAFHPNFSGEFVKLAASAASVTLGYAVLGTALSLVLGLIGGFALSERVWEAVAAPTRARRTARVALRRLANDVLILPRSVHEVLWALVLLQIYGFAPIVAVLAIGIPFGAVTAMVFAETIDESDSGVYESLRSSGVGRFAAVAYGIVPVSAGDFISYSFYRFECAIRSAAILGIVGATGLGYQLDLSFKELHYREMWTLIGSLVIIGGAAEILASRIRRRHASGPVRCGDLRITQKRASDQRVFRDSTNMTAPRSSRRDPLFVMALGLSALSIPWAWHQIHLDLGILWSARRRARWSKVAGDLFSPHLGPRGWRGLIDAASDTFAMSLIAIVISVVLGLTLAAIAARAPTQFANRDPLSRFRHIVGWVGRGLVRVSLLLTRAVPPSIWAFVVLLVMFPGVWPGAIALGVYNAGVLGRLFLETFEDANAKVQASLINVGAQRGASLWYSVLPLSASRIAALALYRWEVVVRETVIVGVVGAAGLGRLVQEDLVARDLGAVSSSIIAIAFLSMIVSRVGSVTRRLLR